MSKWILWAFFVLAFVPRAQAASSDLLRGETVSDKAQQITGRSSNWKTLSNRMRVYHPVSGRNYAEAQFNRLPVGTLVEFPDEFAIARPIEVASKTVNQICDGFIIDAATSSCAERLIRRHRMANITPDTQISRTMWIPIVWQVRPLVPVQTVPETRTSPVPQPNPLIRFVLFVGWYWFLIAAIAIAAYFLRDRWTWRIKSKARIGQPRVYVDGIEYVSLADAQAHHRPPQTVETPPETERRPHIP